MCDHCLLSCNAGNQIESDGLMLPKLPKMSWIQSPNPTHINKRHRHNLTTKRLTRSNYSDSLMIHYVNCVPFSLSIGISTLRNRCSRCTCSSAYSTFERCIWWTIFNSLMMSKHSFFGNSQVHLIAATDRINRVGRLSFRTSSHLRWQPWLYIGESLYCALWTRLLSWIEWCECHVTSLRTDVGYSHVPESRLHCANRPSVPDRRFFIVWRESNVWS